MNGVKRIFVFSILLFIIPNAVFAKDDRHLFQHSYILKNLVNGKNQYKQAESYFVKRFDYNFTDPKDESKISKARKMFKKIKEKNLDFATQLSELPDFNDGIDDTDIKVLTAIVKIIRSLEFPKEFPIIKSNSHPLKILSFMILDGMKYDDKRLSPSLEAWTWQIKEFLQNRRDISTLLSQIHVMDAFNYTVGIWKNMSGENWEDFDLVTSRLNTPDLLKYFEKQKFSYATTGKGFGCGGYRIDYTLEGCSVKYIFGTSKGNCGAFTVFTTYTLKKAGYESHSLKIFSNWRGRFGDYYPNNFHWITLYKNNGFWYTMDNSFEKSKGIFGPFGSLENLPYRIISIEW